MDMLAEYIRDITSIKRLSDSEVITLLTDYCNNKHHFLGHRYDLLTADQRLEWNRIKAVRSRLINSHLPWVVNLAKRYRKRNRKVPIDDLIQEGNTGLVVAIDSYKIEFVGRVKLITYATWWIKQSIRRALQRASVIGVPSLIYEKLGKFYEIEEQLAHAWCRQPSVDEILEHTDMSTINKTSIIQTIASLTRISSMHTKNSEDESYDQHIADHRPPPETEPNIAHKIASTVLNCLHKKQLYVIVRRFGLDGNNPMKLVDIGNELGVTRERIRQIEKAALKKLEIAGCSFEQMYIQSLEGKS